MECLLFEREKGNYMRVRKRKEIRGYNRELEWLAVLASRLSRKLIQCRVAGAAALRSTEVSILITSDAKIRKINREWRHKDKATDVLSFPLLEEGEIRALGKMARKKKISEWYLGDIVISVDTALRQAKQKKISLREELAILLVHGFLHL